MSKMNTFLKVLLGIVVSLLIVGAVLLLLFYLNAPQGLYIEYNGTVYGNTVLGSSSGGLSIPHNSSVSFTIGNSDGWGVYSVQDCTVKIVPNVDDTHDFEFTVEGDNKPYLYSYETDLTAAFCENYDGNGLDISADGIFTITTDKKDIADILASVYGSPVVYEGEYFVSSYPYIALNVISPDGSQSLTIPLLYQAAVEGIELDKDGIVF